MSDVRTIRRKVFFTTAPHGRRELRATEPPASLPTGRVPRLARLMAIAIRFDELLRKRVVRNYAELARLGRVTRARLTQIMRLRLLASDIQEALLFLPPVEAGREPLTERDLRPIVALDDWQTQRRLWAELQSELLPQRPPAGISGQSTQ